MERAAMERMEQRINREVKARFAAGAVQRVVLLRHGDDPAIEPEQFLVRVFIEAAGETEDHQRSLDEWAEAHQAGMKQLRRELSLRLPEATLLEFTIDGADAAIRITMPDDPALTLAPLTAREIVATALALLRTGYVFPDLAERAAAAIEVRLAAGEYDGMDEATLAEVLTSQLDEVCADKHLRVRTMPSRALPGLTPPPHAPLPLTPPPRAPLPLTPPPRAPLPLTPPPRPISPEPAEPAGQRHAPPERRRPPHNYGIYRAERLDGNVGYLDLRGVADPEEGGPVMAAAMELVSGTYALIIDLRRNHGGSPLGVVFWCSYLFPGGGVHLNDIFDADTGETMQFWTMAYVPGSRYLDRPVYVLTSAETFSGGEDLCYTLQAQGRAEVIGERTGGGAHPTRTVPISATMAISVPFARSINPVTGTNWQGTGVVPDTGVPAAEAYDVAYGKALRHVLSIDVPPPVADEAAAALAGLSSGAPA